MTTAESTVNRWSRAILPSYQAPQLTLVRGRGAHVWDDEGREYVDLVAGLAVNALGHAHPAVVSAVTRQISQLGHVSNLVANEPSIALAERLVDLAGGNGKVFFANSGAEANEAAFKLARRTGRPTVIAAEESFHGRTMGALALTGQPGKRKPFEPLPAGVSFVPYGDGPALEAAVDGATSAVFLEPVQGEAGVVMPPEGYLQTARSATQKSGALLVLDEVQTGIARTGVWFAHQSAGVRPDVMTLAKGLGGGLPIGACIAFGAAAELFEPGQHGSTFGGNPVACAAALAVLDTIQDQDLCARSDQLGKRIADAVEGINHPLVSHVRGAGLLLGIVLTSAVAGQVETAARDDGYLVNAVAPDVVRLAPPLVLADEDVDAFLAALPHVLDRASADVVPKSQS